MYKMLRIIASALTFLLSASALLAQVATGTYPYGTFDNQGFDTVNVGNLNVHFSIPVLHKAGRGIPFTYDLGYDNSVWAPVGVSGVWSWQPVENWGWRGITEATTGYVTEIRAGEVCPHTTGHMSTIGLVVYHDPWGTPHPFPGFMIYRDAACNSGTATYTGSIGPFASDGSGYSTVGTTWLTYVDYEIISPKGKVLQVPVNTTSGLASSTDSNGNEISVNSSGQFTDTTGNVVLTTGGGAPSPQTFTYKDTSGNSQAATMYYTTYTVQTAFGCMTSGGLPIGEYGPMATSLVSSIQLADGSTYTFSYENTPGGSGNKTGRLASVTLPQGGIITYTYTGGSNGIECADGTTATLTRVLSANAGSSASNWSYSRSITGSGTSTTAVVDGLNNNKIYTFVDPYTLSTEGVTAGYYETSRTVYEGATTGTPVVARNTCYDGTSSPCTTAMFVMPASQIDTYETLNGLETHGTTTKFNANGAQTESDVYDFGATTRGALLRKEVATYGGTSLTLPTEVDVYDGSSNQIGKTVYAYDGTTPTASSGVPQHVTVSAPRENLTTQTSYANSTTSYSSTMTYEDTGSLLTGTGPTGTATLSYDSTFVYNTGATLPTPSSGVVLGGSETYDTANTGLPLTATDPNTRITRIPTYDNMLRPTEVEYPDGGEITWSYSPTTLITDTYQSASVYSQTQAQRDGYGRQSRMAETNGQGTNPWYQQDTCYDGNGNVSFSSYQYQGIGWGTSKVCSGSGDSYSYDVLGRLTNVTRANGETRSYSYKGRASESTDENSVKRISQVDGLGRTSVVCEISSNSSMPGSGSPASCGTDIVGTGFISTYAYATASGQPQTTVTQGAQTRIFRTDWLGRTTFVQEPESGQTTYSYAYNSTGLVATRTRPKANQTSSTVLTTTTTQYDKIGRPLTVTYTDGTPTKTFAYDASAGTGWSDLTQVNLKGRLSLASVSGAGAAYSYDSLGRPLQIWDCAPSTCGTSAQTGRSVGYAYDLAGNVTSESDGASGNITYGRSVAGEVTSITNQSYSLTGGAGPATLVSNVQNGPNGPISYSFGNGRSQFNSYDALGRLNGGWVCGGTPSFACSSQAYGFYLNSRIGSQVKVASDNLTGQGNSYGYDEFNRLKSMSNGSGQQTYAYVYDRYGNRWQQNALQGGLAPQYSFNTTTNQISTSGYAYDAAGNMTNDGFHTYTYDAEGNIIAVDGGGTATYVYDALNHKVREQQPSQTAEYVFDAAGRVTSNWTSPTVASEGHIFWDGVEIAFRSANALTFFEHKDWLQTDRVHTDSNGTVAATYTSLPFGDGGSVSVSEPYADWDFNHFGDIDYNLESNTYHAQFRQYNSTQGRWMRPDPYSGSYSLSNPQSFNRYAYVLNNPLAAIDPTGQDCVYHYDIPAKDPEYVAPGSASDGGDYENDDGYNVIGKGDCDNSIDGGNGIFIDATGVTSANLDSNGDLAGYNKGNQMYNPNGTTFNADFVTYGFGTPIDDTPTSNAAVSNSIGLDGTSYTVSLTAPNNSPKNGSFPWGWPINGNMLPLKPGTQDNKCTTGPLEGPMDQNPAVLRCCQAHDNCYAANQCNATSWIPNPLPWGACNVCNAKAAACITGAVLGH